MLQGSCCDTTPQETQFRCELLISFRPVSNFTIMSKILEKVVGKQLVVHRENNSLRDTMQSAYRCFHSTETALVRIQNDLLRALDEKKCCFLVMLDLSAAFDTVDHDINLEAGWKVWHQRYCFTLDNFLPTQTESKKQRLQ